MSFSINGDLFPYSKIKYLDESEPSPVEDVQSNDMTAREFFDSPESPITLDKICSPVEKEFLLDTIEMYAKGRVHQALNGQQTVGEDVQRMYPMAVLEKALDDALNQAYYSFLHPDIFPPVEHTIWVSEYLKYLDGNNPQWKINELIRAGRLLSKQTSPEQAHPPAPAGMEEAVRHIRGMMLYMTQGMPQNEAERIDNARCAGFNQAIGQVLTYLSASTPPAKEQTSKLPGVDNTQVKPSDPQMVKEVL